MKTTVLSMMRAAWAVHPEWVSANLPLITRYLKGETDGSDLGIRDESTKAELMYSPLYRVGRYTDISELPKGSTALVNVVGVITKYGGMCSYGAKDFAELTNSLSAADNIDNIIFHIDSPGGQVSGTQLFADAIKTSTKRTIAFINDGYAASAAMWIASACDDIYCSHDTDEVGSIGVYCKLLDGDKFLESQGMPVHEVYAPQSTEKNGEYRAAMAGNYKPLEADLKILADAFISTIKENRGAKLKGDAWQKGAMFYAQDALKLGLIDGIKNLADIMDMLQAEEVDDTTEEEDAPDTVIIDSDDDDEDDDTEIPDPNAHKTNANTMFGNKKYKALGALENKAADEISAEDVAAANAELKANGIYEGLQLMDAQEVATLREEHEALTKANADLSKKPGGFFQMAQASDVEDPGDETEEDEDEKALAALPHNQKADKILG